MFLQLFFVLRAVFLTQYRNKFGDDTHPWQFVDVIPPDVTEWWQAAAMIDW